MLSAETAITDFTVDTTQPDPVAPAAPATASAADAITDWSDGEPETPATPSTRDEKGRFVSPQPQPEQQPPAEGETAPEPPIAATAEAEQIEDPDIDTETGLKKSARPYKLVRQYQEREQAAQRELAQLRAQMAQQAQPAQVPSSPVSPELGPRPSLNDFGTWDEWAAADSTWQQKVVQAEVAKARAEFQQASAHRDQVARFDALQTQGREKYPDFDAVVAAAAQLGALWSPLMTQIVLHSPQAIDLAYALAKEPETARRLAAIADPSLVGFEMGQFVTRVAAARTTGPVTPVKPQTSAKAPLKPVGASATVGDGPPPDDADLDTHISYHNRVEKRAIPYRR